MRASQRCFRPSYVGRSGAWAPVELQLDGPGRRSTRLGRSRRFKHCVQVKETLETRLSQNTSNDRDAAPTRPFAAGSPPPPAHPAPFTDPSIRPPKVRSLRAVVPPPPRRLIDRASLEASGCETDAFTALVTAVRIAAHCTTACTPARPPMWHNGHHRPRPWLPGRPARTAGAPAPLRPTHVLERQAACERLYA